MIISASMPRFSRLSDTDFDTENSRIRHQRSKSAPAMAFLDILSAIAGSPAFRPLRRATPRDDVMVDGAIFFFQNAQKNALRHAAHVGEDYTTIRLCVRARRLPSSPSLATVHFVSAADYIPRCQIDVAQSHFVGRYRESRRGDADVDDARESSLLFAAKQGAGVNASVVTYMPTVPVSHCFRNFAR